MNRPKRPYRKSVFPRGTWTTDQDSYLIENNALGFDQLRKVLPYSEDEIQARREVLGLVRRSKQLRKLM